MKYIRMAVRLFEVTTSRNQRANEKDIPTIQALERILKVKRNVEWDD